MVYPCNPVHAGEGFVAAYAVAHAAFHAANNGYETVFNIHRKTIYAEMVFRGFGQNVQNWR